MTFKLLFLSRYSKKSDNTEFAVSRTVHVDVESEFRRRRGRHVDLRTARVQLGGLAVSRLGYLRPEVVDRRTGRPVPVGFSCTR